MTPYTLYNERVRITGDMWALTLAVWITSITRSSVALLSHRVIVRSMRKTSYRNLPEPIS